VDRGDRFELSQHGGVSDIAGVEDGVDFLKELGNLGVENAVGVRDNPYPHTPGIVQSRLLGKHP
jgi:hypothetical protein